MIHPHKRIARFLWIYCILLSSVAFFIGYFTYINYEYVRPEFKYGYFPGDDYSDLRIGGICDSEKGPCYSNGFPILTPILLGRNWKELLNEKPKEPYKHILRAFHTYDSDYTSETYGRGIVLRVYNLENEMTDSLSDEESVYQGIANFFVNDSSDYRHSNNFAPYTAIETPTYLYFPLSHDSQNLKNWFRKDITIFANARAYRLTFYADKDVERPAGTNTLDFLDAEFIKVAKKLNLHSYKEWQEESPKYLSKLRDKRAIFISLYIICILGALFYAFRYYKNIGNINPKAAKIAKILSVIDFATFLILGIGFIAAFCSIHHSYYGIWGRYSFSAYISDDDVSHSVWCYGIYFLLLIIPTNWFYLKSYTHVIPKITASKSKNGLLYWLVRPFALISIIKRAIGREYHKQVSGNK